MKDKDIIKYVKRIREIGIQISVKNNELNIKAPKGAMSQEMFEELKRRKSEVINYLSGVYVEKSSIKSIENLVGNYPISNAQRRLWVVSQFEGGSAAHNLPASTYLNQDIEIENFKRAIDATIDRHEILRTVFRENESGEVRQWVLKREDLGFVIDYRDFRKEANRKEKIEAYIATDTYREFDLTKGPLLRAALLQVEEEGYVFYFNMHHIMSDGWSRDVLTNDVLKYYQGYQAGNEPEIQELRIQYKDYSAWQLAQLNEESFKAHHAYWLEKLSGELPLLNLPSSKLRPKFRTYNGRKLATYLDKATTAKLKGYIQEKGGSLFVGLLASLNVLMHRYTSEKDMIIGTPVAGREHADLEDQIGCYVNMLALRNEVNPEESFGSLYSRVKQDTLKNYNHQMYPFDRLVEELDLQRDTSRSAVFDVTLILQNIGERIEGVELSEDALHQTVDQGYITSKFDLEITAQEIGDYLCLNFVFNQDVYEKTMIEGLVRHYKQLLNALLETPEEKISQIGYLSEEEKHKLLVTFNDTAKSYPKDKTIVDLFEEQALKTPDNIALVFAEKELTYRQLNEKSNQLAAYLQKNYDIQPEELIGIQLGRSEWMIISILGVLKAGGAYVPIDPEYPSSRKEYIVKDSAIDLLITEASFIYDIEYYYEGEVFAIDVEFDSENYSSEALTKIYTPGNLAYVIYTSGSTGKPKGVLIQHSSLVNLIVHQGELFGIQQEERILLFSKYTFDASLEQLFLALSNGATLVVLSDDLLLNTQRFAEFVNEQRITHLHATPSFLDTLTPGDYSGLKRVIAGGEECSEKLAKRWSELVVFYNEYGPTETTVTATITAAALLKNGRVTIGKPLANLEIYVVGRESQQLVPVGVAGEICIGGNGLARGYLNQEELTREKFIANPFKKGERLYKTGDSGRWLPDGNIEFIGRKDDQVKIRGYRIELGEIEYVLAKHSAINQAVVIAKKNQSGEKELVAYITSNTEQNTSDLRVYLKEHLPEYMLPAHIVQLRGLPLTTNGKVDKKSLPDPKGLGLTSGVEYVAPGTELEEKLVKIWEEVLERENIGVNDDFFALGGHSLKVVRLSNEYQKELSTRLSLKELFAHTSVASHAVLIASSTREAFVQIEKVTPQASYAISDGQRRLWVLSQFEGGSAAYNMPASIYLNQNIEIESFKRAIDSTIERHEILRTVFREDESGEIRQWVLERQDLGFSIDRRDFSKEANKQEKAGAYIAADAYRAFDLAKGPLLRAALLQVAEAEYVFYFNMHHIISDGWSMEVLSKEVLQHYESYKVGKEPDVEELRIQYKDYSAWQLSPLSEESFRAHRAYWLDRLSGELPLLDLPGSKQRPKVKTYNGHGLSTYLDKATTAKLKRYTRANGGSLFMGLLASWNVLMYRYTSQKDIIIGTPIAGREHADLEDQIGFYMNTLALRNEVNPEESFDSFYSRVKEDTLKSYSHQMYPFDRLVEELDLQRDTSRSAVFDIMLILQNNGERIEGVALSEEALNQTVDQGYSTSKFDIVITAQEIGELSDYLSLNVVFNPDVYEKGMVEGLIRHYKQLINALLETPDKKISQIDYLSEQEKYELLVTFNDTAVAYPKDKMIVDLFEEQVSKTPGNVAVVFEDTELTYGELNERSNQLAHYLRANYDIQPDDLVGIKQERSEWMIISILGVLKSGGAYVPIDMESPRERVQAIVEDSKCKVLLDPEELVKFRRSQDEYSRGQMITAARSSNLAYIIYTSGSTGKPKGVMIEHHNVTNFFTGMTTIFGEEKGTFLSMTNLTFDISVLELLWTLSKGYKVVIQLNATYINDENNDHKPLDFSLFYFGNYESGEDKYKLLMEGAKYADENDYLAVWTPERHFNEFGGLYPNPTLMAAALSSVTQKIGIRAGSVVLPLNHPIKVAEDWSVIDNLSRGRVAIACASGWHPDDFVLAPDHYEKRHKVMYESIDTIRKLWKGETVAFENGTGDLKKTKIFPRPVQDELPIWITSAGNKETFISAGKIGANILTHMLGNSIEDLAEKVAAYRKAYVENGHDVRKSKVTLMLHTYIDTESNIELKARQPLIDYLKSSVGLLRQLIPDMDQNKEINRISEGELGALYEYAYKRFVTTSGLIGTKEKCFKMLKKLSNIGIDEIASLIDFGVDYDSAMQSLNRLTELKGDYNASQSNYSVYSQIRKHKVTHLQITPSMGALLNQHLLSDDGWSSIKNILLGGEPATNLLVYDIYRKLPQVRLYNMYGPTETTIWSAVKLFERNIQKVEIGKPIANTSIYILDQHRNPVPAGVQGEIYIGGEGVARGYTSKELTDVSFIGNPFVPGERIYRTGDFGTWLNNGSIYCSGRRDQQVKIRGYRIELGEIEHALLSHEEIKEALVLARENQSGEKELVAYITSNVEQNTSDLRAYLKDTLPRYMLPAHFVQLRAMPLTSNGKVDKKSLPDPGGLELKSGVEYVAPKNKTEEKLIEIWIMVLGRENIGMNDDFFDLGGFSMRAIGLVAEYNKSFNVRLTLQEVFEKTKLYEHAKIVETRMWLNTSSEEKALNMETIEF